VLTGLGLSGSPLTSLACPKIYGVGFGWMRKNKNKSQGRHGSHNLQNIKKHPPIDRSTTITANTFWVSQSRCDPLQSRHILLLLSKCLRSASTRLSSTRPWGRSKHLAATPPERRLTVTPGIPPNSSRSCVSTLGLSWTRTPQIQNGRSSMASKNPRSSRSRSPPTDMTCSASRA
jgi:hypothetical protein